jgi:exosortase A-associated hydrolase 2
MGTTCEAFFLPVRGAQAQPRFCIHHLPQRAPLALAVYVHPFAEEMNKSRRMAALQSRAFAAAGVAVLQIDLLGCGDSAGELDEANWPDWLDDVAAAVEWLRRRHGGASPLPLWLWGLRTGCLLAVAAAERQALNCNYLFWHPVHSGATALQQFLRLKTAGAMQGGAGRVTTESLRRQLARGEAVEVAGYRLAPDLAHGLEGARLTPPAGAPPARVLWLECSLRDPPQVLPASTPLIGSWTAAGHNVQTRVVAGPSFWQSVEVEEAPALIATTTTAICEPAMAEARAA